MTDKLSRAQVFSEGYFAVPRNAKRSRWICHFVDGLSVVPHEGLEPNWFHRKMQNICFGFRWEKRRA